MECSLGSLTIKYSGSIWKQVDELWVNSKEAKLMKNIPGFNGIYTINEQGEIYQEGKRMSPINNGLGYYQVKLRKDNKRYNKYVHRLVWETFKGTIPVGYELNHIDHDKSNNSLLNLELVSHKDNLKKAVKKHGKFEFLK